METKYTRDGKKVVVCGKINSTQYIVQEIFVTKSGDELPSGENFTADVLLDEPAKSWKSKEEERQENRLQKLKSEIDELEKKKRHKYREVGAVSQLLKRTNFVSSKLPDFDWDSFCDVISGNMKYVVQCNNLSISKFDDKAYSWYGSWGEKKFEGIRSLSLWARGSEHRTEYRLGNYQDMSGYDTKVIFFKDKDQLINYLEQFIKETMEEKGHLTANEIKEISVYMTIDKNVISASVDYHKNRIEESHKSMVANAEENKNKSIREIEKLLSA